jgi:hypothetical protein
MKEKGNVDDMADDTRNPKLEARRPGLWQRSRGRLSEAGRTISGAWESSPDGSGWQHDFDPFSTRAP